MICKKCGGTNFVEVCLTIDETEICLDCGWIVYVGDEDIDLDR